MRDLVNYMVYMGEPAQMQRKQIGYIVLIFLLAVMLPLAYFLKKNTGKTCINFNGSNKRQNHSVLPFSRSDGLALSAN